MLLKNPHIVECFGFTHLANQISIVLELSEDGPLDKVSIGFLHHLENEQKPHNQLFLKFALKEKYSF
jgi:hypothetical protein